MPNNSIASLWHKADNRPDRSGYILVFNEKTNATFFGYYIHENNWFYTIDRMFQSHISFEDVLCTHYLFVNDILPVK